MELIDLVYWYIAGYLAGSIPFGLLIGKMAGIGDIRSVGSGNIGATNMVRAGGKKLGALVLLLDMMKGFIPVLLFRHFIDADTPQQSWERLNFYLAEMMSFLMLFVVVLGHMYPVWLKFKGGKGVATTIGTLLATLPWLGFAVMGVWLVVFLLTRYSSLAALVSFACAPVMWYGYFYYRFPEGLPWYDEELLLDASAIMLPFLFTLALVFFKHRENIRRLIRGEENRFSFKK